MRDTLHVGLPATDWHPLFGALIDDLNGDKARGYRLQIANRLFGQDGVPWATAFLDTCETDWNAPFEPLDIAADPDAARGHINDWVSDQTQARIPELLTPGTVTADTRLVLVNAIYFLADWWTQFDVADTRPGTVHRLDGSSVQTPMMTVDLDAIEDHRVRAAHVDDGGGATVIRVPYEDDEVSAWIVLPDVLDGLAAVEATLDEQTFPTWAAAVGQPGDPGNAEGHFVLPKFELRWHKSLVPALQSLGMIDAFDGLLADFSPMADGGAADGYVISDVVHEAWVRVDEQGTEAAAATAVIIDDTAAPMPLVVDHPFLLAIRDDLTGSLLFVGRITDPTQPG
jgi:serpin B